MSLEPDTGRVCQAGFLLGYLLMYIFWKEWEESQIGQREKSKCITSLKKPWLIPGGHLAFLQPFRVVHHLA